MRRRRPPFWEPPIPWLGFALLTAAVLVLTITCLIGFWVV